MLDLGLSKMALIGVVALVVLGPERLPRVARTAGALFGRAQRYINDVKAEVSREIELDALRTMKTDFETAARNVETTIHDNLREHEKELNDTWNSAVGGLNEGSVDAGTYGSDTPAAPSWHGSTAALAPKRRNWRVKQAATPVWYKRATTRRTHVQSGAARVARHQPASLRRPTRFF
ncbi:MULTISPECIES: Sec-independent protein translocase protein TatB [unclassified Burkholderia]|uniref:Sec-independent protein translocase protein TatB n=1 Tax=unclassified Burkholderia TaxID=2613784 RepID=UPI000F588067|nr:MULTISPECIES: Sec-independent protein translocase protein TatB [unclassified Burkholderia]RQR79432.1 Sec-independent protein translocase subunit TatB [Burkholderia sp. Bp9011]RQR89435.1 Sec-independent protein translocase subunit TatB [Burkholderia sp. Bp9010]RQS05496.1 Sec-independent protein translocase subunit TatB [Burkholderia sp. Bp8991]RQS53073.1 Sec-independent protein translocase subunit TatB [Burkholderia sp. Bp8984]RQS73155.1 Sec-independent protein translocase subunit TatB [Burk